MGTTMQCVELGQEGTAVYHHCTGSVFLSVFIPFLLTT